MRVDGLIPLVRARRRVLQRYKPLGYERRKKKKNESAMNTDDTSFCEAFECSSAMVSYIMFTRYLRIISSRKFSPFSFRYGNRMHWEDFSCTKLIALNDDIFVNSGNFIIVFSLGD